MVHGKHEYKVKIESCRRPPSPKVVTLQTSSQNHTSIDVIDWPVNKHALRLLSQNEEHTDQY